MKIRIVPIVLVALLLSLATSEARSRRHPRNRQKPDPITLGPSRDDEGGGPLARSRGLSQTESAAVGTVLAEVAGSSARAADAAAAQLPNRRFSPDYYRVYSRRMQASGSAHRVAVAAPVAKTLPAATPAPVKPVPVAAPKVAVLPPVAKVRAVAKPTPTPAPVRRVAVAAPIVKPPVAPTPTPVAALPATVVPKRVLMLPPGTKSRTIVIPVVAPAPPIKKRKSDETIYVAGPQATGPAPIRSAFREADRR